MAMAFIAMAYMVMAYMIMAYMVMAYLVMAYIVMAYIVMAYIVLLDPCRHRSVRAWVLGWVGACVVMARTVMAQCVCGRIRSCHRPSSYGTVCMW